MGFNGLRDFKKFEGIVREFRGFFCIFRNFTEF